MDGKGKVECGKVYRCSLRKFEVCVKFDIDRIYDEIDWTSCLRTSTVLSVIIQLDNKGNCSSLTQKDELKIRLE